MQLWILLNEIYAQAAVLSCDMYKRAHTCDMLEHPRSIHLVQYISESSKTGYIACPLRPQMPSL